MIIALLLLTAPQEAVEFFEKRIRPVLAQECYACHGSGGKAKGGLVLDHRDGLLKGGDSGPAIVPGKSGASLLLRTLRHEDPDLKMPQKGAKLEDAVIRDFARWIDTGAVDPRDVPPTKAEIEKQTSFAAVIERRKQWWSFQPVADPAPPPAGAWSDHPVDRFLLARMERDGLRPGPDADPRTLARRLRLVLTGLPPAPEEVEAFVAAFARDPRTATAGEVDRLLALPAFGERWARHWMDVMRYAETHGSEDDPRIPHAWRWRDYLVRAFNADVPFPQLVREQIAGDLLETPRILDGLNESALGPAHLRMVLHGFSPTDSLDELVTFTDNQIDTVTKAFLGLTVSCARCHDHKFDPISQADFTALYGIFASTRPAVLDVNVPERKTLHADRIRALKEELRPQLADAWSKAVDAAILRLREKPPADGPLSGWAKLAKRPEDWAKLVAGDVERARALEAFRAQPAIARWDLRNGVPAGWTADGSVSTGSFALHAAGDRAVSGILPAGVYSHLVSDKHRGVLASPRFTAEPGKLWIRARGGKGRVRYVVQNYPRTGTVHFKADLDRETDGWVSFALDYWKGDRLHLEITTRADPPLEGTDAGRSWFGVSEIVYVRGNGPAPPAGASIVALLGAQAPDDLDGLAGLYAAALRRCIEAWRRGAPSDEEADFLGAFLREGWLPNHAADFPLIEDYRRLEAAIPEPTRAPGVLEGDAADQPLFVRGDHKHPAATVPRRFLEAIDATPYAPAPGRSGRRELAESLLAPGNPLPSRVFANRVWQHLFGRGLVATPDNFGRLGDPPTHPELLDFLARRSSSLKDLVRLLATSRAFRLDARPSREAVERDPDNRLLSRFPARRLEAEAIRDSMLVMTGKLDPAAGGPSVDGKAYRRSVYVKVVRNALDPLLAGFDFPVPAAARGKRDATNVPAQSLNLMNDPSVTRWAADWAARLTLDRPDPEARITRIFEEAYGRGPSTSERDRARAHLAEAGWPSLALALLNTKEFIYVR